jgi:death on curing protein
VSWRWIGIEVIDAIHDQALADHGGGEGTCDRALIESALARAQNLALYGEPKPDAAALAAAYAFGLAKNHGYLDGNKRIAWVAARLFLADNNYTLVFDPVDAVSMMEQLASNTITEDDAADWFRKRLATSEPDVSASK